MKPPLHVVHRGDGPDVVLVHGSASDADGWTTLFASAAGALSLWTYDRRGTDRSPLPPGRVAYSVADHARDLLALLDGSVGGPAVVIGSSFGAVVALAAARIDPAWFRGLVLCEPPLPAHETAPPVPDAFMDELLRVRDAESGEAAGRFFLRRVLGAEAYAAMRPRWIDRCAALHAQIVLDCQALQDHRPRYGALTKMRVPSLLVGGDRSVSDFAPALDALERAMPRARRVTVPGAGHIVHADAPAVFAELVVGFVRAVQPDASEPRGSA